MKIIKRKQNSVTNGVKSSNASESKLDTKMDIKLDSKLKITTKTNLTNKSEILKTTDQLSNKTNDKKDKMSTDLNGTNNSSLSNGLMNKTTSSVNIKNLSLKEKKKSSINNTNQLNSSATNSLIKDENLKDNENGDKFQLKLINDRLIKSNLQICDDQITSNLNNSLNISSNCLMTNSTENNNTDLSLNSKLNNKRELDSDQSNTLKKKSKLDTDPKDSSTSNAATMTESDCLGFAEPGTSVVLEGAVLDEIEGISF